MQVFLAPGLLQDLKSKHDIHSDTELAKLLGCDRSTLIRMDSHEIPVNLGVASRITKRFHVPFSESVVFERNERAYRDAG